MIMITSTTPIKTTVSDNKRHCQNYVPFQEQTWKTLFKIM